MAKYSQEFKLEVVKFYLSGFSKQRTGKRFSIAPSDVYKWVVAYQQYGLDGLMRKTTQAKYTTEFKIKVVQIVINEGLSLNEAALRFEIGNKGIAVSNWLKLYKEHGIDGLKAKPKGRSKQMPKPQRPRIKTPQEDHDKSKEQLLEELEYLRAENAYLKKRRALIQKQKEQEKAELQRLQDSYLN